MEEFNLTLLSLCPNMSAPNFKWEKKVLHGIGYTVECCGVRDFLEKSRQMWSKTTFGESGLS